MSDRSAPNARQDILAAQRALAKSEAQAIVDLERAKRSEIAKIYDQQWVTIDELRLDGDTQPRAELDAETVNEYAETMKRAPGTKHVIVDKEGEPFPPIIVYRDSKDLWLADGFHRVAAAKKKGYKTIQAERPSGGLREAIRYSIQANATHGKRRTNEDKRRAILKALQDEEWVKLSDRKLAEMCKVSGPTVAKVRKELEEAGDIDEVLERVGADGRVIKTANIGATAKTLQSPAPTKKELAKVAPTIRKRQELPDLEEETSPDLPINPVEVEVETGSNARAREEVTRPDDSPVYTYTSAQTDSLRAWGRLAHDVMDFDMEVLVAPMPARLGWPVNSLRSTHLDNREQGAVIIGTEIYLVWSSRDLDLPTTAESLAELVELLESEVAK